MSNYSLFFSSFGIMYIKWLLITTLLDSNSNKSVGRIVASNLMTGIGAGDRGKKQ